MPQKKKLVVNTGLILMNFLLSDIGPTGPESLIALWYIEIAFFGVMVFYPAFIVFCRRISLKHAISSKSSSVILSSLIHSQSLIERVFNLLYFQYFRARNKVGVFFTLFSHFQTIFLSSFKIPSYFETHAIRPSPPFLLLAAVLSQAPGCLSFVKDSSSLLSLFLPTPTAALLSLTWKPRG